MLRGIGSHVVVASKSGEKGTKVLANIGPPQSNAPQQTTRAGAGASGGIYERGILDGFINEDDATIRRIARNIYQYDPVSGTVIDILSQTPFSPFELTALPDQKMLNTYAENIDSMDTTSLSPEIARTHMVDGVYVGQIDENTELDIFTGIVPIDIDACNLTYLPFANRDPIIDVTLNQSIKNLIKSKDPRIQEEFSKYGTSLSQMATKGTFPLDPRTTIFFPHRTLATFPNGTSYLKRIIPVWLYEKALLKGTIDLAHRRQKSILHLMIGDEEYLPTEAQLGQYAKMFADADADPTGAVIATRPQVQTNEIRNGSDFWKIDETNEFLTQQKMRGLGVSDSLLSGDLTVDGTTQVMTIFLDKMRSFREAFTRKIYYQKVLLNIAIKHGFERKTREAVTGQNIDEDHLRKLYSKDDAEYVISYLRESTTIEGNNQIIVADNKSYRLSDYHLPKLQYHKALKPEGNSELMTNLQTMQQQGLNIPLRIWAVAAGISVPELMRMMPEDIKLRKQMQAYKSQWPVDPNAQANQLLQSELITAGLVPKNRKMPQLRTKDPDTGRMLSTKGAKYIEEKRNRVIAEAVSRLNMRHNHGVKLEKNVNKRFHYRNAA